MMNVDCFLWWMFLTATYHPHTSHLASDYTFRALVCGCIWTNVQQTAKLFRKTFLGWFEPQQFIAANDARCILMRVYMVGEWKAQPKSFKLNSHPTRRPPSFHHWEKTTFESLVLLASSSYTKAFVPDNLRARRRGGNWWSVELWSCGILIF